MNRRWEITVGLTVPERVAVTDSADCAETSAPGAAHRPFDPANV